MSEQPALIITADDYGYAPGYDRGILEAAGSGAVDAVGAMVTRRRCDPAALRAAGVEIGLHLELPRELTRPWDRGRAQREATVVALRGQLERFERLFDRPPAYLDGHRHCHARPAELAALVAQQARRRNLPVRSIDAGHRRLLRAAGVPTPDLLIGRLAPHEPALPDQLRPAIDGTGPLPPGVTEWMVHPGHPDPAAGSGYDRAREEDLDLLLGLRLNPTISAARRTHAAALG